MRQSKRHTDILRILRDEGTVTISNLASRLDVSLETIRRDVQPLAVEGLLVKMHGAITLPGTLGEEPFENRLKELADEKRAIAHRMAELIDDGDSLMMDTGTTTTYVARALLDRQNLTVVTNSSQIARTLSAVPSNRVFLAGGRICGDNGASFGNTAVEFVSNFKVRHAIITIGGLDPDTGAMDFDLDEAEFARAVLRRGDNRILVTDHSKFMRSALVKVCDLSSLDIMVSDRMPPQELADALDAANVATLIATLPADKI